MRKKIDMAEMERLMDTRDGSLHLRSIVAAIGKIQIDVVEAVNLLIEAENRRETCTQKQK